MLAEILEDPLTFIHSEPEPDISIIRRSADDYKSSHPNTAEFVIEVAVSSLRIARLKIEIYAESKIPEYWIVNVEEKNVEVYKTPEGRDYKEKKVYAVADTIHFPQFLAGELPVAELFV
ncbi:MAG TPA: Uma2 family endonuclease [Leptospiraceae bacterium]|nr:Uma2 family endonuclease [Leptospiraceae bacterium]HMW05052.1 Uma2 family endonuclease [Leptospiraceae bacterium]HMX31496.1 Uma2 family endonuclease [Leptospiraceae bacterium]HMY31651.1 Uma2 family endonuclease [Leptospiraceae bacterium]HMZ62605.1 Uma2 family endonuclease [Leptospiraceae bacterium]